MEHEQTDKDAMIDSYDTAAFIDEISGTGKGKPWSLSKHQRTGLKNKTGCRHYAIRLWSEIKKSGKTFLAACKALKEAVEPDSEVVCCANDLEQSTSRVFAVCRYANITPSWRSRQRYSQMKSDSLTGASSKPFHRTIKGQAGGRQRLTIFDELWALVKSEWLGCFEK